MTAAERHFTGYVATGRAKAAGHIAKLSFELEQGTGAKLYLGSLNILLDRPVRLNRAHAITLEDGRRLLWPARLNGVDVWLYRWRHAPLHVAEILAETRLRDQLGLADHDKVTLSVRDDLLSPTGAIPRLAWEAVWRGRRSWCYARDRYYLRTRAWCIRLGATQQKTFEGFDDMSLKTIKAAARRALGRSSKSPGRAYAFCRTPTAIADETRRISTQVLNLLNYTKTSNTSYSAQQYPAGYHSITLNGEPIAGQRDPARRLAQVPYDFSGKSVLDIGCNQGGMLHALKDSVKWAVGIDYDPHMVNAGNRIRTIQGSDHLNFYVFDLAQEPLDLILDFLPSERFDICFLLSVCMWIPNWRAVIDFAQAHSDAMLFETNGTEQQQQEQLDHLRLRYTTVQQLAERSEDDPGQKLRMLLLLTDPIANESLSQPKG